MLIIPKLFMRESPRKDQSQIEHRVADCKYSFEGLGFPERFLEFKFPYIRSKAIAGLVISELRSGGIKQKVESKAWIVVCGRPSLLISTLFIIALLCSNSQLAF